MGKARLVGDDKVHKGERSLAKTEFDAALKSVGPNCQLVAVNERKVSRVTIDDGESQEYCSCLIIIHHCLEIRW